MPSRSKILNHADDNSLLSIGATVDSAAFNLGCSAEVSSPDFEGNFTKGNPVKFQLFI